MKEPYETKKEKFIEEVRKERDFPQLGIKPTSLDRLRKAKDWESLDRQAREYHEGMVIVAYVKDKPIPAEVLKDYPDLMKQQEEVK